MTFKQGDYCEFFFKGNPSSFSHGDSFGSQDIWVRNVQYTDICPLALNVICVTQILYTVEEN